MISSNTELLILSRDSEILRVLEAQWLSCFFTLLTCGFLIWCLLPKLFNRNCAKHFPTISWINCLQVMISSRGRGTTKMLEWLFGVCFLFPKEGMHGLAIGRMKYLFLYTPEAVESVLKNLKVVGKGIDYEFFKPLLRDGLVVSTGNKWRMRRKLVTPAFHFRNIDKFLDVFNKQAKILVVKIDELMKTETRIEILDVVLLCTSDIALETVFGKTSNGIQAQSKDCMKAMHKMAEIGSKRVCLPWLWSDFVFHRTEDGKMLKKCSDLVTNFASKIIEERKRDMAERLTGNKSSTFIQQSSEESEKNKQHLCLLDFLMNLHLKDNSISLEEILGETISILAAAQDTFGIAVSWTLYFLGKHQKVQRDVQMEIDMVLGADVERTITSEDISCLKYLHCALKEAMRLYPPFGLLSRTTDEDIVINGCKATKGTAIIIPTYVLHRNPEMFPNPEEFIPERFTEENSIKRSPFSYVPFSVGPRNCIGQRYATHSSLTILATVLRHFDVISLEHRDRIKLSFVLTTAPENGLHLRFTKRRFKEILFVD